MPPAAPRYITHCQAHPMPFRRVFPLRRPQSRSRPKETPGSAQPGPAPGAVRKQPTPPQFIFLLLQPKVWRSANLMPSSVLLGCFFSFHPLSLPLFPCLRAGKATPACLQGRNVSPDIVSSTHKTLGCFLATAGRAVDDRHVSSHKCLKGGTCNPGQG